jgi:hypothetical protein
MLWAIFSLGYFFLGLLFGGQIFLGGYFFFGLLFKKNLIGQELCIGFNNYGLGYILGDSDGYWAIFYWSLCTQLSQRLPSNRNKGCHTYIGF